MYEVAENYHASLLQHDCIKHALEHFDDCAAAMRPKEFAALLGRMVPTLRSNLVESLLKCGADEDATQPPQEPEAQAAGDVR